MANIRSRCPHCFAKFMAPETSLGREMNCTKCGKAFTIAVHEEKPAAAVEERQERYAMPLNSGYFYAAFWAVLCVLGFAAGETNSAVAGIGFAVLMSAGAIITELRRIEDRWRK